MNLLFSCIGKRGYIANYFREALSSVDKIFGTGNTPWTPGFAACDASFILPDIGSERYVDSVLDLCRTEKVDALFSFNDNDVYELTRRRSEFSEIGVRLLIPKEASAEIAFDKYKTFTFLRDAGIRTPRTAITISESESFGLPVVVKPRRGSGSRDTFIARSPEQVQLFFHYAPDMIIQEYVKGSEFDIELCGDLDGNPIGFSTWIKHQSRQGETERAETFHDSELFDLGLRLGRLMQVPGPMDIDLIKRDGEIFVLEFNPRFGGGYPVSQLAGADFPKLLVDVIRNGKTEPYFGYRSGVMMMKQLCPFGGFLEEVKQKALKVVSHV
ncbi:ATP-grasp domain-containing protein [Gammaproteobacteria bacterium]